MASSSSLNEISAHFKANSFSENDYEVIKAYEASKCIYSKTEMDKSNGTVVD